MYTAEPLAKEYKDRDGRHARFERFVAKCMDHQADLDRFEEAAAYGIFFYAMSVVAAGAAAFASGEATSLALIALQAVERASANSDSVTDKGKVIFDEVLHEEPASPWRTTDGEVISPMSFALASVNLQAVS